MGKSLLWQGNFILHTFVSYQQLARQSIRQAWLLTHIVNSSGVFVTHKVSPHCEGHPGWPYTLLLIMVYYSCFRYHRSKADCSQQFIGKTLEASVLLRVIPSRKSCTQSRHPLCCCKTWIFLFLYKQGERSITYFTIRLTHHTVC